MIQCLTPSAVTSLGSPAKLLTLCTGALPSAWTSEKQKLGRDGSNPVAFFWFSHSGTRACANPESRSLIISGFRAQPGACHRAAQSADPLGFPRNDVLLNALRCSIRSRMETIAAKSSIIVAAWKGRQRCAKSGFLGARLISHTSGWMPCMGSAKGSGLSSTLMYRGHRSHRRLVGSWGRGVWCRRRSAARRPSFPLLLPLFARRCGFGFRIAFSRSVGVDSRDRPGSLTGPFYFCEMQDR